MLYVVHFFTEAVCNDVAFVINLLSGINVMILIKILFY